MLRKPRRKRKASMLITMSILFITIIGFAAVAVDVGHLLIARNELQNAADAAALAGANCLNRTTASSSDCTNTPSSTLNWAIAGAKASSAISLNIVDGRPLVDATVTTGYKNLGGQPTGLQPNTLSPIGMYDMPAVMVSLSKASGKNGGPVQMLITAMFGAAAVPITVNAVAAISSPGGLMPATPKLIPQVINKCMFDQYWNSTDNSPKLATSSTLNGVTQVIGQSWELRIGSSYHYPVCDSGQWTSFDQDVNSSSALRALMASGNPTALRIGDNTWIQPGTKGGSYNDLSSQYPTPPGADVTLLVVDLPSGLSSKGNAPIVAFAAFHIDDIQGGSGKYIQGHFISGGITAGGSSGIGSYSYGTYTPPRLAQ